MLSLLHQISAYMNNFTYLLEALILFYKFSHLTYSFSSRINSLFFILKKYLDLSRFKEKSQ